MKNKSLKIGEISIMLFVSVVFLALAPNKDYAYIDLGTSSYLIQILLAGILGSLFVFKSSLAKVITKIRKMLSGSKEEKPGNLYCCSY